MGVPVIDAASEAESQCAELAKKKKVWGMASEDMDSLTFGTPVLIRHLTKSQGSKKEAQSILEVDLAEVLEAMENLRHPLARYSSRHLSFSPRY